MACAVVTLERMPAEIDHFTSADRNMLIALATKMDLTREDVKDMRTQGSTRYDSLELRVRTLENFRWWIVGAVAIVAPVLSACTSWLVARLHP